MRFGDLPNSLIQQILREAPPIRQETSEKENNLGYGNIYYSLIRTLRPAFVLLIGSGHGFTPVTAGLAVKDNGKGRVVFVDPSYARGVSDGTGGIKEGNIKGEGKWSDPAKVKEFFSKFGLDKTVTHYKQTNYEFFNDYSKYKLPQIDFAIIDGCHSYANAKFDLVNILQRIKPDGIIVMHDADHPAENMGAFGVRELLNELDSQFNVINIPGTAGLAILQRKGEGYVKTKHAHYTKCALYVCIGIILAKYLLN